MKSIKRVYEGVVKYHTAEAFSVNLPAEQPQNKTMCSERQLKLEEADEASELLWQATSAEKD